MRAPFFSSDRISPKASIQRTAARRKRTSGYDLDVRVENFRFHLKVETSGTEKSPTRSGAPEFRLEATVFF